MRVLSRGPAARADRAASQLLHDEANSRIVAFQLQPGQTIAPHRSDATVITIVITGSGRFSGADSAAVLKAGDCAVFAPGEEHAIDAGEEPLRFLAVIAPRPGG